MLKSLMVAVGTLSAMPALAAWQLDSSDSQLHFLSTKNAQVTEVHEFRQLEGSVDDSGALEIQVDLSSVATGIDIRDTRMQNKLFNTSKYTSATFSGTLPDTVLTMTAGTTAIKTIEGAIDLQGKNVATTFTVMINRLNDTTFTVATVKPTLLKAGDFGLAEGVKTLQSIAGLESITMTVPVTFAATFTQQ